MKGYSLRKGGVKIPDGKIPAIPKDAKDKLMVGLEKGIEGYAKKGMRGGKGTDRALKVFGK